MKQHKKPVMLAMPDGFAEEDLYQNAYTRTLEESAHPIVDHNRRLLTRQSMRGFRPSVELDFTANGAGIMIHRFFEAVADYAEGRVPWRVLTDLFTSTDRLVDALKGRENAPVCELDAAGR